MSCSSFQTQFDVANNIFTPATALSTDIGLCRIDESNESTGILMVRNNGIWGSVGVSYFSMLSIDIQLRSDIINAAWHTPDLVCRDAFNVIDADSACYTLGYTSGGTQSSYDMTEWSEAEIPFLMDEVQCESASTNFLSCSSSAVNCAHTRNVLLTCFSSG